MWLKHVKTMPSAPSPSHQHFYGWYIDHQKWDGFMIVLICFNEIIPWASRFFPIPWIPNQNPIESMKIHGFPMGRPRRTTCVAVASCAFRRFASCSCCCCSAEDRNSASWSSRHGQRALQKAGKAMGTCGKTVRISREKMGKLWKICKKTWDIPGKICEKLRETETIYWWRNMEK